MQDGYLMVVLRTADQNDLTATGLCPYVQSHKVFGQDIILPGEDCSVIGTTAIMVS